ncbi:MAG: sugar transferase [Candidatus Saccharimonadales bacterium]
MKNNASFVYSFFLLIGDFLALIAAFVGAYLLRVTWADKAVAHPVTAINYLWLFVTLAPFWLLIFALLGLYNRNIYEKRFREFGRLLIGSFVGLLFVISVDFVSVNPIFPAKLVPVYGFLLAFLFLVIFRNLARWLRTVLFSYNMGISNVLIFGDTDIAEELVESLSNSKTSGYRVVGLVSARQKSQSRFADVDIFVSAAHAFEHFEPGQIDSIIQTELYGSDTRNNEVLEYAQTHHISYRFIPGNSELFVGNIEVDLFRSSVPVVTVHQTPLVGWGRIVKRLFDLIVSLILLVVLSPVFLLIVVAEFFSVGKSIFFRQDRLTRFNRKFRVFKFRTMNPRYGHSTAEEDFVLMGKAELAVQYRANGDFLDKDPRITGLGRFLRRTSLDELPQLFNVLKGDLSLVGPRALIPQELEVYAKRHAILSVKSGLTGLAQVSGRRQISFEERRKLDIYYVQNWTFWMDLTIMAKTIRVILSGEGAQ